ncbi:MAG: hypothetical protein ACK5N1_05925, partial [Gemmatimonas sp.]
MRLRRQDVGTRFANGGQARQGLSLTVGPGKLGSQRVNLRMRVDVPAPFGPSDPNMPGPTVRESPC